MKYFYRKDEEKICASDCTKVDGYNYLNGNECVPTCPEKTFLQDAKTKVCGPTCESKTYRKAEVAGVGKHNVCSAKDDKCDTEKSELYEILKINGEDYTHCLAKCEDSDYKDEGSFKDEEKKMCVTR